MLGCICYLDLLGMSYFTKVEEDSFTMDYIEKLIVDYHVVIENNINENIDIKYTVISDSVFLYLECKESEYEKILLFLITISSIFRDLIKKEILIRAGISFGNFYMKNTKLNDKNIYGEAVTKAVNLESTGKGARIFANSKLIDIFNSPTNNLFYLKNLFEEYNSINYENTFAFNWSLIFNKKIIFLNNNEVLFYNNNGIEKLILDVELKRELIKNNSAIIENFDKEDSFKMNKSNREGELHLIISKKYLEIINSKIEDIDIIRNKEPDNESDFNINNPSIN